jgi:hypothetical protein
MKVDSSTRQDVALINVVLKACKESDKVTYQMRFWKFRAAATILDGRTLDDSAYPSYAESLRSKRFSNFCTNVINFLLMVKMLGAVEDTYDNFGHAVDVVYIRTTALGSAFMLLPNILQRILFFSAVWILTAFFTVKQYRWVASIGSLLTAAFHWTEAHNLTHATIYFSLLVGLVSALIVGWLGSVFNTGPLQSDDDSIG